MHPSLGRLVFPLWLPAALAAQEPTSRTEIPTPPRPLGEAEEVALALSAAPEEISSHADVYVLQGTEFVKVRTGSNGCACLVARDLHAESRYPICYDREGVSTLMRREMMEGSLRAKGISEEDVQRAVRAAYDRGELHMPSKAAIAFMMSPKQVLYSSPGPDGTRVGAWAPHLMITLPGVEPSQLGLKRPSSVDIIQIHAQGTAHAELVVKVPKWSDGQPVANPRPQRQPE